MANNVNSTYFGLLYSSYYGNMTFGGDDICEAVTWSTDIPMRNSTNMTTIEPTAPISSTGPPPPSCEYMGPEPPNTPEAYCTCDGKSTLPLTTIPGTPVAQSASCSYTAQPNSAVTTQLDDSAPAPITYSSVCRICTPYGANGADCNPMTGCTPAAGALTIQAGSFAANVGTLTSDALYTSISSALDSLCPTTEPVCDTGTVEIDGIAYVDPNEGDAVLRTDGKLLVSVESSSYTQQSIRDSLISGSAQSANGSATGTNCVNVPYNSFKHKRSLLDPPSPNDLTERQDSFGSDYSPQQESLTLCGALNVTGMQYYAPNVNIFNVVGSATSYISAGWSFQQDNTDELEKELLCDFVNGLIDSALVEIPDGSEVGGIVGMVCKGDLYTALKDVNGIGHK